MNKIEEYKKEKDGLDILQDIPRYAAEGWEKITDGDKERLKWAGVFFRRQTPGRFMMRLRVANGFMTATQLRTIGDIGLLGKNIKVNGEIIEAVDVFAGGATGCEANLPKKSLPSSRHGPKGLCAISRARVTRDSKATDRCSGRIPNLNRHKVRDCMKTGASRRPTARPLSSQWNMRRRSRARTATIH